MTRKAVSLLVVLCMVSLHALHAQDYNKGLGIRLGGHSSGFTFRGFTNENTALEGILSFGHKSFFITGLYEKFKPIENAEGLTWFYGGGVHIGFFKTGGTYYVYKNKGNHVYVVRDGESKLVPGVDFIIGMDYKFNNAPLNLGLDMKPFMDFIDGVEIYFDAALSFRFVF